MGCKCKPAARKPLISPDSAPTTITNGTIRYGDEIFQLPIIKWTTRTFNRPISGPTEIAMRTRRARITGVEAMAARINGAASPNAVPSASNRKRAGLRKMLMTKSITKKTTANCASPNRASPNQSRAARSTFIGSPEHGGDDMLHADRGAWQFGKDAALPENKSPVTQLQNLFDLGRQQDERGPLLGHHLAEYLIEFHARWQINAARRIVEQHQRRMEGHPTSQQHLLLIAAAQTRDRRGGPLKDHTQPPSG